MTLTDRCNHMVTDSEVIIVHIRHAARDVPEPEELLDF